MRLPARPGHDEMGQPLLLIRRQAVTKAAHELARAPDHVGVRGTLLFLFRDHHHVEAAVRVARRNESGHGHRDVGLVVGGDEMEEHGRARVALERLFGGELVKASIRLPHETHRGQHALPVQQICKTAFRMTVLAYDPYVSKEKMAARSAEQAELKDLLRRADYVSMHCPRTQQTLGLVGYDELCLMQPTAFFINTSRGGTYKEADLARALTERKIAGAGIDVFLEEPPPTDHPLMAFDNVILTPHNAGSTREAHQNVALYASEQWIDIFDGKVPPRLVNRQAWPKYCERFQTILGFKPEPLPEE